MYNCAFHLVVVVFLVIARHALPCLFLMDNRMTWSHMRKMTAKQLQWILPKGFCNWCVFLLPIRLVSNCCSDSGTPQDPSPNSTA